MTWPQVVSESPFLTAIVLVAFALTAGQTICLLWNRLMRSLNLRKNGWPPEHCDADGDSLEVHRYRYRYRSKAEKNVGEV